MSSDQRPGKMRVVSAGQTPGRRRGDQVGADGLVSGGRARGDGLSGMALVMLFLIGCVAGGALLILSGLVSAADF
ncbi:hypothetical protein [Novosphingobium colocasiae]|uniref:Uncharacterized protein n=1 Tax=Novosphingobium colocasiae TaxID=1256513 RepID=A0A918UFH9_9SPHN|nr:hypothetical protein [Novosphingobium colocasiae]GGZ00240.1 hypothetical protein GCM10011614_14090 [Novosphingobium colocasiae]